MSKVDEEVIAVAVRHLRFGSAPGRTADARAWAIEAERLGLDAAWAIDWICHGYPDVPAWISNVPRFHEYGRLARGVACICCGAGPDEPCRRELLPWTTAGRPA
jgi:hypothetical protein